MRPLLEPMNKQLRLQQWQKESGRKNANVIVYTIARYYPFTVDNRSKIEEDRTITMRLNETELM